MRRMPPLVTWFLFAAIVTFVTFLAIVAFAQTADECRQLRAIHASLTPQQISEYAKILTPAQIAAAKRCLGIKDKNFVKKNKWRRQ